MADARSLYVARTFAYVAAGREGLVIVDVERPEHPKVDQSFTADGKLSDVHDVKVAMTNASVFAYVADGVNGSASCSSSQRTTRPEHSVSVPGRHHG